MCCFDGSCARCVTNRKNDEALRALRAKLTGSEYREGYGKVTFTRTDGRKVVVDNVDYDGIGVDAGQHGRGVVSATMEDGSIIHLPFIEYWSVEF